MNTTSELRSLGRTDRLVSRVGLGLAALGRPGYINIGHGQDLGADRRRETMELGAHAVLDAAFASGVRYFDAARSYGLAEEFLASWLVRRGVSHDEVTIGSKWGYTYTAGWRIDAPTHEVKAHTLAVFERQLRESRAILGRHLALYQIHSATQESAVLEDSAVIDALAFARGSGLRIGLTVSGPKQAEAIWQALDIRRDGSLVFDTVQATWNLLERSAEQALRAAHEAGLGVIVKEVLANGRLTSRAGDSDSSNTRLLGEEAERLRTTEDALAIAAALAEPWVDVVLSGATTVAQLQSNLRARELVVPPSATDRLRTMITDPSDYWRTRSQLPWN